MLGLTMTKSINCSAGGVIVAGRFGNCLREVSPESRASPATAEGRLCEWQELHPAVRMNLSLCVASNAREFLTAPGMERSMAPTVLTFTLSLSAAEKDPAPSNRAASV